MQRIAGCVGSRHFTWKAYASCHRYHSTSTSDTTAAQQQPGIQCHTREDGSIATIAIRNARKMNIVNSAILTELTKTCHDLHSNKELRAVVLTGGPTAEGKAASFIGGADIREMHALSGPEEARSFITKVHDACQALRDLPVPVIARVHGFALGAGLEIMASCDLRVATMQSRFAMPEVRVGIPSVVEAALLPQLIGYGRTRRLLYLADNIEPPEALQWGLVEKVVQDEEELDRSVDEWLTRLCSMGPLAIRSQKRLIRKWESCSVEEGIQAGIDEFADAFAEGAAEPRAYMKHFVDRRGSA